MYKLNSERLPTTEGLNHVASESSTLPLYLFIFI